MPSTKFVARAGLPFALALLAPGAFAQSTPTLREVVVSPSRIAQDVVDALPATTVITRDEIEQAQTPDLPTLLQRLGGLEIVQNGGPGTVSSTFLRGTESRHTLVLVDGVPINNLDFGTPALEHLSVADIDHIEIVRGNVSSLYGSAAIGGVIQIFTRQPTATPQASITVQAGSRGLVEGSATGSVLLPSGTGLRATVEGLRDRGFDATSHRQLPGTDPDRDGYRRHAESFALTQDFGNGNAVGLKVRDARGTTQYDSQFGPATQPDESRFEEQQAVLDAHVKLTPALQASAALTTSADKLDASVTAFPYFVHSRSDGAQAGFEWQAARGQRVSGGIEHTRQHIESDTAYARNARTLDSARLGYNLDRGRHQLQLNLRQDRYSDFGSASTWLAGYGYQLTDAWRVSGLLSTGFNAPTFNDLYFPLGGNPRLRPEHVRSRELGLQYAAVTWDFRATLFDNRFRDLIGDDALFNRINIGHARTRGIEFAVNGRFGADALHAGLTSQDPRDLDTGARLQRRADTLANVAWTRTVGAWRWGADARYAGRRPDAGTMLGSYAVFDLTASYQLNPRTRLFGRIENAFDRQYETVYGYRQAGRGVFVGVTWQPKS